MIVKKKIISVYLRANNIPRLSEVHIQFDSGKIPAPRIYHWNSSEDIGQHTGLLPLWKFDQLDIGTIPAQYRDHPDIREDTQVHTSDWRRWLIPWIQGSKRELIESWFDKLLDDQKAVGLPVHPRIRCRQYRRFDWNRYQIFLPDPSRRSFLFSQHWLLIPPSSRKKNWELERGDIIKTYGV